MTTHHCDNCDKLRAERDRVAASFMDGEHDCDRCGRVTANLPRCTECRHGASPLVKAEAERDRAVAEVAVLREALKLATAHSSLPEEAFDDADERIAAALASTGAEGFVARVRAEARAAALTNTHLPPRSPERLAWIRERRPCCQCLKVPIEPDRRDWASPTCHECMPDARALATEPEPR